MGSCDIYFIRLYKMVLETCKSVLWEMLTQMVQTPDDIINVVEKITKDPKKSKKHVIENFKKLLEFWKLQDTIPLEIDFDLTNLYTIILFYSKKEKPEPHFLRTVEAIHKKRNTLAHAGSLSKSEDEYNKEYREIREYVDLLESEINGHYRPNVTCKGIRQNSSKYLNQIDRIHKEYIEPETCMKLTRYINQWRKDLEQDIEEQTKEVKADLMETDTDFVQNTKCDIKNDNQGDLYDKDIVEMTLNDIKNVIRTADENKRDLNEQAKNTQKEAKRQQTKIEALEMSIVNMQNKVEQGDTIAEVEADHGSKKSVLTGKYKNLYRREQYLTHEQEREKEDVNESTDLHTTKCDIENDNQGDMYENDSAEKTLNDIKDVIGTADENKRDLNKQEQRGSIAKVETDNDSKKSVINEEYKNLHEREQNLTHEQEREIEEVKESTDLHITKCKRQFDEELKFCMEKYKEALNNEKVKKEIEIKRLEDQFESDVAVHKSMFEPFSLEKKYEDLLKIKEKGIAEIEEQYEIVRTKIHKELEKDKLYLEKKFKDKQVMIALERRDLIEKIKQKTKDYLEENSENDITS